MPAGKVVVLRGASTVDTFALGEKMGALEILSEKRCEAFAEQNSRSYAERYVTGEALRRRGQTLQGYAMVGIDKWAQGLRAGYFGRQSPDSAQVQIAGTPEMEQKRRRSN